MSCPCEEPTIGMKLSWSMGAGWLAWLLAAAILAVMAWYLDLSAILDAIRGADLLLLVLAAIGELLADYLFGAEKYRVLLGLLGTHLSRLDTFVIRGGTLPLRQLMPFRSGELLWMGYLRKSYGVSFVRSGVATVLDMGLEVLVLLAILGIGIGCESSQLQVAFMVLGCLLVGTLIWWRLRAGFERSSAPPDSLRGRLELAVSAVTDWMRRPETLRQILWAFACAGAIVVLDLLLYVLVFRAVGLDVPLTRLLVVLPLITFATGIPATPLGMGTREAALVLLFADVANPEALFASAILASAIGKILPVLAGVALIRPAVSRLARRELE